MEMYCLTGQIPQRAVAPTEEEEEGVFTDRYVTKCEKVIAHIWTASSPHNREPRQLKLTLPVALEDEETGVRPS
jgi:hypothetical protein